MDPLLTEPRVVAALIALIGVLTSVILSSINGRRQVRAEMDRLVQTIAAKYEEKIVERRIASYPPLWELLAQLSKAALDATFEAGEMKQHIVHVQAELDGWHENHGLLLSKDAYGRFHRLRHLLHAYCKRSKFNNPAELVEIRRYRWDLRQALRADIYVEPIQPQPRERRLFRKQGD